MSFQIYPELALKMKAEEQFDALRSGTLEMSVYPLVRDLDLSGQCRINPRQ
jgi:hypothetical protein